MRIERQVSIRRAQKDNRVETFNVGSDGVSYDRTFTDALCFIVLYVVGFSMIVFIVRATKYGNPDLLMSPFDINEKFCGHSSGFEEYPYLYMPNLQGTPKQIFNTGICVRKCPVESDVAIQVDTPSVTGGLTLPKVYKNRAVLHYCFPDLKHLDPETTKAWREAMNRFLDNPVGQNVQDMLIARESIFISMSMALVLCLLYILFLGLFGQFLTFMSIIMVQVGLVAASLYFLHEYAVFKVRNGRLEPSQLNEDAKDKEYLALVLTIGMSVATVFYAVCLCCNCKSLKLAAVVIDSSADFLAATQRIFLVPIFYFFVQVGIFMFWLFGMGCINSDGDIVPNSESIIPQMKKIENAESKFFLNFYMVVGLLWIITFVQAKSSFITMISAAMYYFTCTPETQGAADLERAARWTYWYHQGSLAMGSGLLTIMQVIKFVLVRTALKIEAKAEDQAAYKCFTSCTQCILTCLEDLCQVFNENAYCYMAITGKSFCTSGWEGSLLNLKHFQKYAIFNVVTWVFILIGKCGITILNCILLYTVLKYRDELDDIQSLMGPMFIVALFTFFCANMFLNVFDEVCGTFLMCYCVDIDYNGTSKYGPASFHEKSQEQVLNNRAEYSPINRNLSSENLIQSHLNQVN